MTLFEDLNGWQRLWVVVITFYFLFFFFVDGTYDFPTKDRIEHAWVSEVSEVVKESPEMKNYKSNFSKPLQDMSNEELIKTYGEYAKAEDKDRIILINEKYEFQLKNLFYEQLKAIGFAFFMWLSVSLGLYVFGWLIGWIYLGFKK